MFMGTPAHVAIAPLLYGYTTVTCSFYSHCCIYIYSVLFNSKWTILFTTMHTELRDKILGDELNRSLGMTVLCTCIDLANNQF